MENIELTKKRIARRKELREQGASMEELKRILVAEGLILGDLKEDSVKNEQKVYCFGCKQRVEVLDGVLSRKLIKNNSYRNFLTGTCKSCGRKVSGLLKMSPLAQI